MAHLPIDQGQVDRIRNLAKDIANHVQTFIEKHSSISVERAVLRLMGVDGITPDGVPIPNRVVEILRDEGLLAEGVSRPFARAMLKAGKGGKIADAQMTAQWICDGKVDFKPSNKAFSSLDKNAIDKNAIDKNAIDKNVVDKYDKQAIDGLANTLVLDLAKQAVAKLDATKIRKEKKQENYPVPSQPWKYLIVATGNIYEDRTQAIAGVQAGADIIAVIRTTAQSLLDYIPYGPTTEGFGGTYATQANFKIMREALDKEMEKEIFGAKRYLRLTNYSSGLCMAEIAVCAALEDLDMLLNDSMYGILFRDINMKRTFVDQYFSRLICTRANIIINTGEDNYLTTADAIEAAHTVVASQFINEALAIHSRMPSELMGLGHAFEINPKIENAFLYELAHAQLIRQLFPNAPLKYMPPTKHKSTDVFFSHAMDTLFNMASVTTQQGIHLAGILTEANHTPLMMDRYISMASVNYVFHVAKSLGDEIEFKKEGFVAQRAAKVLDEVEKFLETVKTLGLMQSIAKGYFADIKRGVDGGKGLDGVFTKGINYFNPILDLLSEAGGGAK